ncbi:MAG: efflux RND transporter periplasmic adaptor subunit [Lachnospiraceae bacterium]|nr:efflux RND transporter periplasmic adaptor subunit [Lachnospiraceae bacterium]
MKKSVKIVIIVLVIILAGAGAAFYLLQPQEFNTVAVTKGDMEEDLELKAAITTNDTAVISSTKTGLLTELKLTKGAAVKAGDEVVNIDDTEYQNQLADQIKVLQKQKAAVYTQGQSSQSEIELRQEQLIQQMASAQHDYEMMFGEKGTAAIDVRAAKFAMDEALANYEAADDAGAKGATLDSLSYAYAGAAAAYQKAELMNSATNKFYYQSLLAAYQIQFETLTDNGNNGADSIQLAAAQIQDSIDSLKREQDKKPVTAPFNGVVSEVLVETGAYVTENQPIARLFRTNGYELEAWMLTEDVMNYKTGDPVEIALPDGSLVSGSISFISPMAEERMSSLGVEENRCAVKLSTTDLPEQMGPGYEVEVHFKRVLRENALSVPVSALVTEDGVTCVYVVADGKKTLVPVTTGVYSGGMVEIISGLQESDIVILAEE